MSKELKDSIRLIRTAGEAVLNIYERKPNTFRKKDRSVVTEADLVSQKIISDGLSKYKYGILSEEGDDDISRLKMKRVWILDPLDGTLDFLQKTGEFSIMLALVENGQPILGVVFKPDEDKLYYAEKGEGSFLIERDGKPKRLKVSDISGISEAKYLLSRNHLSELEKKLEDSGEGEKFTHMGSFGVKWGIIAEGRAEVNVNPSNKSSQWDTAAPEVILREAGGEVTDLSGKEFVYNVRETKNLNGVVASNKTLHRKFLERVDQLL